MLEKRKAPLVLRNQGLKAIGENLCDCNLLEQMRLAILDEFPDGPNPISRHESTFMLELANGNVLAVHFCPLCGGGIQEPPDSPTHEDYRQARFNRATRLTAEDARSLLGEPTAGSIVVISEDSEGVHVSYLTADRTVLLKYLLDPEAKIILSREDRRESA